MKKSFWIKPALWVSFLSVLIWIVSCAVNPVTGKREFMLLSDADEVQLGQQSDPQVIATYGLYDDAKISQFITAKGKQMAAVSHRPQLDYQFRVLDTPVINAFAVPGGYVYFTRGILAYLNNEAEMAGVLGHEIGHITARHSAKQYSRSQLAMLGLGVGVAISEDFGRFAGLAQSGLGLLFLRFGRDAERESDELGVEYSTKIGYDAREMANFFETLDRMSPGQEGGLPGWFSTHPAPAERVGNVRQLAAAAQQNVNSAQLKVNRDSYLDMIEGLVYGDDPNHGYVDGNMFYHPSLRFQFPIPAEWKTINTPSQVQVISSDQKAVVMLSLLSGTTPADAAAKFQTDAGAQVIRSGDVDVNGFPARMLISDVQGQQGVLRVVSYFILYENNVYVFHGISAQADFANYQPTLESVMKGFKKLTDSSKINVKPDRIRVKKLTRPMTLRDALLSFGTPDSKLEELSLVNGMNLTDTLPAGTRIKTVGK